MQHEKSDIMKKRKVKCSKGHVDAEVEDDKEEEGMTGP